MKHDEQPAATAPSRALRFEDGLQLGVGMYRFRENINEGQWMSLKQSLIALARGGSFSADEALYHVFHAGLGQSADEVTAVIHDLVDLGYLRAVDVRPLRWELTSATS